MTSYYVTKYALSSKDGNPVVRHESEVSSIYEGTLVYFKNDMWTGFALGEEVFTDEAEARAAILKARDKKIASLEKQIAKLRKIGGAACA